jgi:hypothetical protein
LVDGQIRLVWVFWVVRLAVARGFVTWRRVVRRAMVGRLSNCQQDCSLRGHWRSTKLEKGPGWSR